MNKKIALVTNVLDYVGPPAVKALLQGGYDVIAQDPAFQDTNKEKEYKIIFPGTVPLGIKDPRELIQYVWDNNKKVDVLVSNDTFPAIHIPIEEANVEDLYATIENVLVYPFKLMKYALPSVTAGIEPCQNHRFWTMPNMIQITLQLGASSGSKVAG